MSPVRERHPLVTTEPGSSSDDFQSSESDGSSRSVHQRSAWVQGLYVGIVLLAALGCAICYNSYVRGSTAAEAAMQEYIAYGAIDLEAQLKAELAEHGAFEASLLNRAGREHAAAENGGSNKLEIAIDEAVTAASERMQDQASDEAMERAVNDLIMDKINEYLSEQQRNINPFLPGIIEMKMKKAKLPQTNKLKIDSFHGAESAYIDTLECYSVDSDLHAGQAEVRMRAEVSTGALEARGRVRPVEFGAFVNFKLDIYGFQIVAAAIVGEIEFKTQAMTSLNTGWIGAHVDSLDGTCYQKFDTRRRDPLCSSVMNKRLRKEKYGMLHKLSAKLTRDTQKGVNAMVPFKLPQKPQKPATTNTTTTGTTTTALATTTNASATTTTAPSTTTAASATTTTAPATTTAAHTTTTTAPATTVASATTTTTAVTTTSASAVTTVTPMTSTVDPYVTD